jgi:hypothetical protein
MKSICFLLGAGASAPYGFPIGSELVTEILNFDDREFPWDELGNRHELKDLQDALRYSDHSSVDILLLHRRDLWKIGTQAIAVALLSKENPKNLARYATKVSQSDRGADRWYGQLFELLSKCVGSFNEFTKLPIIFVTFNYERSFDFFFWQWLQAKYKPDHTALDVYLRKPRILHVHGQLGFLAFQEGNPDQKLDYGRRLTIDILRKAADGIRIPHDDELENSPGYKQAVDRIKEANTIVFLGFGFDEHNFQRLQVPFIDDSDKLMIYGTTYGISRTERERVLAIAGKWNDMAGNTITTRGFLDDFWPKLRARLMQ